ncbi:MAG TPA: RDD family protein [Thermoleophilaceae bacterium]|nr:RDD family protein [Thermoleophilaceae bacterium]
MNAIAQASPVSATGPQLDNRRVLAGLVDIAIVALGGAVVLFAGDALSGGSSDVQGALGAVIAGWALYYYFALESGDGQTVGKKLMKLRVVRADGRPAGMREIAVRSILRVVDGVGLYVVGLIVMLATGQRRQRVGDLAAGTIVVDASSPTVAAPAAVVDEPDVREHAAGTPTITLRSRPARPATLSDITALEAAEDEPAAEAEPVFEDEPVAEEDLLPEMSSPTLEELARDVAAVRSEPEHEAPEAPAEEHEPDEPMTLKSVETVSAIDLVMGGAPGEQPSEDSSEPA